MHRYTISRRGFLKSSAAFGAAWAAPWEARANESGFSGIFPIVQTPYNEAGKIDFKRSRGRQGFSAAREFMGFLDSEDRMRPGYFWLTVRLRMAL